MTSANNYKFPLFLLMLALALYSCNKEHCEDLELSLGDKVIADCPQGSDLYFTMLVNNYCWYTATWKFEENEEYFILAAPGFSKVVDNAREELIITFPRSLIGSAYHPVSHYEANKSEVPTIQMNVTAYGGGLIGSYGVGCTANESNNEIKLNLTNYPVHLECELNTYLVNHLEEPDSISPKTLHLTDSKIRIPITTVKDPADDIILCEDTDTLNTAMLFNGACRTASASHFFDEDKTTIIIVSRPFNYTEGIFLNLPTTFDLGREYEITDESLHQSLFSLSDFDAALAIYEIYKPEENTRNYVVIDEISADSTLIVGRMQAYYIPKTGNAGFDIYKFVHIEECSFESKIR